MWWGHLIASKVAGGTSFIRETMAAFNVPTSKTKLVVDMAGYDCFPALSALEAPLEKYPLKNTFEKYPLNKCSCKDLIGIKAG